MAIKTFGHHNFSLAGVGSTSWPLLLTLTLGKKNRDVLQTTQSLAVTDDVSGLINAAAMARMAVGEALTNLSFVKISALEVHHHHHHLSVVCLNRLCAARQVQGQLDVARQVSW